VRQRFYGGTGRYQAISGCLAGWRVIAACGLAGMTVVPDRADCAEARRRTG